MSVRGGAAVAAFLVALALAGCSEEETSRIGDAKIIDKLKLEQAEGGYTVDGDPFCVVADPLLNTASEVASAQGSRKAIIVASREGNVGVVGVPTFPDDCRQVARKKLNKLDPPGGA